MKTFAGSVLLVASALGLTGATAPKTGQGWEAVWASAPSAVRGDKLVGQTVRQIIRLSASGDLVRLRISNEVGDTALAIADVQLATPSGEDSTIDPASNHPVTFAGRPAFKVAAGEAVVSDPVAMPRDAKTMLSVTMFIQSAPDVYDMHVFSPAQAFIAAGDLSSAARLDAAKVVPAYLLLSAAETVSKSAGTIVVFGDSIADGLGSKQDGSGRISSRLAAALDSNGRSIGVVDEGICGNTFLSDGSKAWWGASALARFDRDVASLPNVRSVILVEGINDVMRGESPAKIIAAMTNFTSRAHEHGINVVIATLTPINGFFAYSPKVEASRQEVNRWIRGSTDPDGIVDFDKALRDPNDPSRLSPLYDHGDHVHPNDAGYAEFVSLVNRNGITRVRAAGTR